MKTKEELQDYIHEYKSKALEEVNFDTAKLNEYANQIDIKLSNQLMTLSSATVAILGTFILTQQHGISNFWLKLTIGLGAVSLFVSILAGLKNYLNMIDFWQSNSKHKQEEAPILVNDKSRTYDDLVKLRETIETHRKSDIARSSNKAARTQLVSFIVGLSALLLVVALRLFIKLS